MSNSTFASRSGKMMPSKNLRINLVRATRKVQESMASTPESLTGSEANGDLANSFKNSTIVQATANFRSKTNKNYGQKNKNGTNLNFQTLPIDYSSNQPFLVEPSSSDAYFNELNSSNSNFMMPYKLLNHPQSSNLTFSSEQAENNMSIGV